MILVHGIGEQKRFEHLDGQGREIIRALKAANPGLTVEIEPTDGSAFLAEQDSWGDRGRGAVQVVIARGGEVTHRVHIHEVWWADVNERYSLAKQFRFWQWGLGLWLAPLAQAPAIAALGQSMLAQNEVGRWFHAWLRLRMFFVGSMFALVGPGLGFAAALLQRLLNLRGFPVLQTLTNYMSGVKLFLQGVRYGTDLVSPGNHDFLDSLDEPPRVSVRRRMIRAIAMVAQRNYHRWYIVAHSQGTVLALNGLMESAEAWPGYFTEDQWKDFAAAGYGGQAARQVTPPHWPSQPSWNVTPSGSFPQVAFRTKIFARFHGLITLGSPLAKFAAIWPHVVPINLTHTFREGSFWINVLDPIDPVSGRMTPFHQHQPSQCPIPTDICYRAWPVLLVAHNHYLSKCSRRVDKQESADRRRGFMADGIAQLLTDPDLSALNTLAPAYPLPTTYRFHGGWWWFRETLAKTTTLIVYVLAFGLAACEASYLGPKLAAGLTCAVHWLAQRFPGLNLGNRLLFRFNHPVWWVAGWAIGLPFIVGVLSLVRDGGGKGPAVNSDPGLQANDPDPSPANLVAWPKKWKFWDYAPDKTS